MNKKQITQSLFVISLLLLGGIFCWTNSLPLRPVSFEEFTSSNSFTEDTHTVDLPLTTTASCNNFCGPTARCSITGQQCLADIDCFGCQPYSPPLQNEDLKEVPGDNDAGKLTWGVTPQYSSLTSGYGTREQLIQGTMNVKPAQPNLGTNTWMNYYKQQMHYFDKRFRPPSTLKYMPQYPPQYSITGNFIENGPLASNAMSTTTQNQYGMNLPVQKAMLAGTPQNSAFQQSQEDAKMHNMRVQSIGGQRTSRKSCKRKTKTCKRKKTRKHRKIRKTKKTCKKKKTCKRKTCKRKTYKRKMYKRRTAGAPGTTGTTGTPGTVVMPQFQLGYTPTAAPGGTPNDMVVNLGSSQMQNNENSSMDKLALTS